MSRRRRAVKRPVVPDPKYGSHMVARLVNMMMKWGQKSIAQKLVYGAIDEVASQNPGANPIDILQRAVDNARPRLEVKPRRVGGATYQVPLEVSSERQTSLALRWLVNFAGPRKCHPPAGRGPPHGPVKQGVRTLPLVAAWH